MPRTGEITYYERLGAAGRKHAAGKPFSDADCGIYFQRMGALFSLLPPAPARLLECGCGTGWLAYFLSRRGYAVTATDVAPGAIELARANPVFQDGAVPSFQVADSEQLPFDSEFDAVVYFDSLHHAVDEQAAITSAFRALRPGGVCIALEPGRGHHKKSLEVEADHDVTEKDMPPAYIWQLGRRAGFKNYRVVPAPQYVGKVLYGRDGPHGGGLRKLLRSATVQCLALVGIHLLKRQKCGIIILYKDAT